MNTCGHNINRLNLYKVKSITTSGKRLVESIALCTNCIQQYKQANLILENIQSEVEWIKWNN